MTPGRPTPRAPGKRTTSWASVRDARRPTSGERSYDSHWRRLSEDYRRRHPLCVPCLLAGRVRSVLERRAGCVDHIVPIHSVEGLRLEVENWCSMCRWCHSRKSALEPQHRWEPRHDRIVVCGLPGTGKTTWARASGLPYWDADDYGVETIDQLQRRREEWISAQGGACVVIVSSITTASLLAARIGGIAKHMTERFVERAPRAGRAAA